MAERLGHIARDRGLRARGDDRLFDALDIDERAPSVAAIGTLERDEGKDAVGTGELAVPQRNQLWCSSRHVG